VLISIAAQIHVLALETIGYLMDKKVTIKVFKILIPTYGSWSWTWYGHSGNLPKLIHGA